jgi:hypothetical protein
MVPFGMKGLKLSNQDIVNVVAFVKTLSVRELEAKIEK